MAKLFLGGAVYDCGRTETVLDALLRQGADVPYSCARGTCLTCMVRAVDGQVPETAQRGLRETLRLQGYFLPCVCKPDHDLTIAPPNEDGAFVPAIVSGVETLAPSVRRVRLTPATPFDYRAGQFLHLRRADGLVRSYSLASLPGRDPCLELHVMQMTHGLMSGWIFNGLCPGEPVGLRGPNGDSFYTPGHPRQGMVLICTGTGLAPLSAIARDALDAGHTGPVHLYHGSGSADGLYLQGALRELAARHSNFHYVPCVSREAAPAGCRSGRADDMALTDRADLTGWRIFLSGNAAMVHAAKRAVYLAGADLSHIHADPFEQRTC